LAFSASGFVPRSTGKHGRFNMDAGYLLLNAGWWILAGIREGWVEQNTPSEGVASIKTRD
jgi:hypothetical protein